LELILASLAAYRQLNGQLKRLSLQHDRFGFAGIYRARKRWDINGFLYESDLGILGAEGSKRTARPSENGCDHNDGGYRADTPSDTHSTGINSFAIGVVQIEKFSIALTAVREVMPMGIALDAFVERSLSKLFQYCAVGTALPFRVG
jgi:hypothetical protein